MNIVNTTQQNFRPLLLSSHRRKERPQSRSDRDPNLASNYDKQAQTAMKDVGSCSRASLTERECAPPASNRGEGLEVAGECKTLLGGHKTHNYLTAGSILNSSFLIPSRKNLSTSGTPPKLIPGEHRSSDRVTVKEQEEQLAILSRETT